MKRLWTTSILTFLAAYSYGQANFLVEGRAVKTGSIVKSYNFYYQYQDSISLLFSDSSIIFTNPEKTIKKEISYSKTDKEPYTRVEYFRTNGEDSISKHFSGDKLNMIYTTRFDSLDRRVYYSMKDFNADSTYDPSFNDTYIYKDSMINTGKISIQTVLSDEEFNFRVLSYHDKRNRLIKEVRESQPMDSMAQITIYSYNEKDSLISEKVDGMEVLHSNAKHINSRCDIEVEKSFTFSNFSDINNLVKQLLNENKKMLTSKKCENYFCKYISVDKQMTLSIIKRQPYWCEGRRVIFTITQTL